MSNYKLLIRLCMRMETYNEATQSREIFYSVERCIVSTLRPDRTISGLKSSESLFQSEVASDTRLNPF